MDTCQTKGVGKEHKMVCICSDDPVFASALRILLDDSEAEVVSELSQVSHDADVLIYRNDEGLDSGLAEVARRVATLVLSEPDRLLEAVRAGSRGFLPTSASLEEIQEGVEVILDGGALVPPDLLGSLLRYLVDRRRLHHDHLLDDLTDREREVFHLAARGARKEEIGEKLFISPATARTHLQRVYRKLGIHSQAELVAVAARSGEFESGFNR